VHPMKWNVLQFLAAIPAVFVAAVSHFVACPACWPLIGGLIYALGLTSLLETRLLPLFVGCLLVAIAPLALQARRLLPPFILGLIASVFVLVGKFLLNATAVTVAGIVILVAAYVWSYRARRATSADACCSSCATPSSSTEERTEAENIPIACALDKAQFEERKALVDRLAQRAIERKAIPSGFALRFGRESELVSQLASFVELERACCPFLTFRIDVRAGDSVWLELTGPAAAQEIIRELIPKA
jgi:prepilin signal peptidase PulO-like enzyme (type II secretory pathway)